MIQEVDNCGIVLMAFTGLFLILFMMGIVNASANLVKKTLTTRIDFLTGRNSAILLILIVWTMFFVTTFSAEYNYFFTDTEQISCYLCSLNIIRKLLLLIGITGGIAWTAFGYQFMWLAGIERWIHRKFRNKTN